MDSQNLPPPTTPPQPPIYIMQSGTNLSMGHYIQSNKTKWYNKTWPGVVRLFSFYRGDNPRDYLWAPGSPWPNLSHCHKMSANQESEAGHMGSIVQWEARGEILMERRKVCCKLRIYIAIKYSWNANRWRELKYKESVASYNRAVRSLAKL